MAKISAKTVKKVGWTASGIWLVVFLCFMAFDLVVKPTLSQPKQVWAESFTMGLMFFIGGIVGFVIGIVYTVASWTMSVDEHYDMLIASSPFGKSNLNILVTMPKSYWLWQNRILTLFFTPFALILAAVGAGILVMTTITYLLK